VITPQAIDPAHPFPFVSNKGIGALFNLTRLSDDSALLEMVLIPSAIPRFVRVPGDEATFIAVEQLVCRFATLLFPGFRVDGDGVFRVLRDSDHRGRGRGRGPRPLLRTAIQRRRRGRVIMLELDEEFDLSPRRCCSEQLGLEQAIVTKNGGMLGLAALAEIVGEDRPDLKFAPYNPRYPERVLEHDGDCFAAIREKDIVIHHPYESFEVVVDFLRQAAADPAVISIKQTLYRAGNQSPVIAALIEAGRSRQVGHRGGRAQGPLRRGAEPQVGRPARARRGAGDLRLRRLEDPRQGLDGRAARGRRLQDLLPLRHRQLPPGHRQDLHRPQLLHRRTQARPRRGKLFNFVTGYVEPQDLEMLAISPLNLRETLYEQIDHEIDNARKGRPAAIWAKLNALTEKGVIDRLYEASQAGRAGRAGDPRHLLPAPGIPGLSDNISVKSILGRFLEHSRIWAFGNGHALPERQG
jgi:polyphosphate kinase